MYDNVYNILMTCQPEQMEMVLKITFQLQITFNMFSYKKEMVFVNDVMKLIAETTVNLFFTYQATKFLN